MDTETSFTTQSLSRHGYIFTELLTTLKKLWWLDRTSKPLGGKALQNNEVEIITIGGKHWLKSLCSLYLGLKCHNFPRILAQIQFRCNLG